MNEVKIFTRVECQLRNIIIPNNTPIIYLFYLFIHPVEGLS